ncbi:MAG: class I SAM-dependent methyltransferase [Sedimentibacter sp.]
MVSAEELLGIFEKRPRRFKLLDKGIALLKVDENQTWLEIGCNNGDAISHLVDINKVKGIGVDYDSKAIKKANIKFNKGIEFIECDARDLPIKDGSIDGIISEAAFSPIDNKEKLAKEYYRVLKKGGYVVVNDFIIRNKTTHNEREEYAYIPCFAGVETLDDYEQNFKNAGLKVYYKQEVYAELISIVTWLSKSLNISIKDVGTVLSSYYHGDNASYCTSKFNSNGLLNKALLSYGQIILIKEK